MQHHLNTGFAPVLSHLLPPVGRHHAAQSGRVISRHLTGSHRRDVTLPAWNVARYPGSKLSDWVLSLRHRERLHGHRRRVQRAQRNPRRRGPTPPQTRTRPDPTRPDPDPTGPGPRPGPDPLTAVTVRAPSAVCCQLASG
ncbi:hypothetical protein EYF80_063377 [Liparis tanakae]|uniref:Uncharacterized protein n=1 Tax=Liparis tanakae TaxID=230148 RepID=A0A4Z2ECB0_9TELE|nr:hypothetical protein EYF80_063377 [Liparis tanakae]